MFLYIAWHFIYGRHLIHEDKIFGVSPLQAGEVSKKLDKIDDPKSLYQYNMKQFTYILGFAVLTFASIGCCQGQQPTPQNVVTARGSVTILDNSLLALLLARTSGLTFDSVSSEEFIEAIEMFAPGGGIDTVNGWVSVKLKNQSSGLPVFSFDKSDFSVLELLVEYCHITKAKCIIANGVLTIS